MTLDLHATPEEVMRAVETLQELAREKGVSEKAAYGLALALEEFASNVVNHGLRRDARETFEVRFECESGSIVVEIKDRGPEFDPTKAAEREVSDDDLPGGWGIQLARRSVDEICYRRIGDQNVLRLAKRCLPET